MRRRTQLQSDLKQTQLIEMECPLEQEGEFSQVFSEQL